MKTKFLAALAAAGTMAIVAVPANAVAITGLYNTGVDANGVKMTSGTDTHYKPVSGHAAPVIAYEGYYYTTSDAAYIASPEGIGSGDFTLSFDLTGYSASTAFLTLDAAADNHLDVFLNSTLLGHTDTFSSFTTFNTSTTGGFVAGLNTLTFKLVNDSGPVEFSIRNFRGTVEKAPVATGAVPEPASWAMMVGGFGMLGAALRRRQQTSVRFA